MVHANADCRLVLLTDINKRYKLALYLLQFLGILRVGILQVLERTAGVYVVAGVDAYLLTVLGGNVGCMGGEVYVGHQRLAVAVGLQTG